MARDTVPTFPARLRSLRLRAGLTQTQLAEQASTSKDSVARLERGDRSPSLRLALALANALGCTLDDLVSDEKSLKK